MNLQQLTYIVALDKHRHFLRASEACFITQATLSSMVKKLEEELGVILFDRSKSPLQPTAIGRKIIDQAKMALREVEGIKMVIDAEKDQLRGDFRIGIIPSLAPYLLPLFIRDFTETHREVKLIVNELSTQELTKQLKDSEIDVAILAIPLLDNELREETLFYEELFHYGATMKTTQSKKLLAPKDIDFNKLLLLEEGHCFREQVLNLCELRQMNTADFPIEYRSGSLHALKQMVDLDIGSTILPELSLLTLSEEEKLKVNNFAPPYPVREIGLVYYHHFAKKSFMEALRKSILASIPKNILLKKNICILPVK